MTGFRGFRANPIIKPKILNLSCRYADLKRVTSDAGGVMVCSARGWGLIVHVRD